MNASIVPRWLCVQKKETGKKREREKGSVCVCVGGGGGEGVIE